MYIGDVEAVSTPIKPTVGDPFVVAATAPKPALTGMGWLDTTSNQIKVFSGVNWVTVSTTTMTLPSARSANDLIVSTGAGTNWVAGDLDDGRF